MISSLGLQKFFARPLRDSGTAKTLSAKKLDRMLASKGLVFKTSLRRAQKVCLLLGWKYSRYLFLLGMGGGKSKLSLDLFANRKRTGEARRCLVVVPYITNLGAWDEEVRKHTDLRVKTIDQDGFEGRWSAMLGKADVVVVTYQGLAAMLCKLERVQKSERAMNRMKPDAKLLKQLTDSFDFVVLDEVDAIKNPKSLWFKLVKSINKRVSYLYALTGTPFDKDPADLWSQFFIIDGGHCLGETLGLYRGAFFTSKWGYFGGIEHTFKRSMKGELSRRLRHCSVRYAEHECQDLPAAVGGLSGDLMRVPVKLPKEQQPYYDRVHEDYVESGRKLALMEAAYLRMRMVCSGWLGAKDESGERVQITFKHNPKFDAAIDLLRKIPENEKVVLVCWFNSTCAMLMKRLHVEKIGAVLVNGTVSGKAKTEAVVQFKRPGGPRVLVASTAISKGVNLQAASRYMVFLESPDSTISRRQLEGRIRREGGSGLPCYYYDIVVSDSVDERILNALVSGKELHDVVVDR